MVKQVCNSEGHVFKQAYGSRTHAHLLWKSIEVHMFKRGAIFADDSFADYDRSTRKDHIETHKYYETKAREEINRIRKRNGLPTIPLRSTDWYHEDLVLDGLEDEKYAQVI